MVKDARSGLVVLVLLMGLVLVPAAVAAGGERSGAAARGDGATQTKPAELPAAPPGDAAARLAGNDTPRQALPLPREFRNFQTTFDATLAGEPEIRCSDADSGSVFRDVVGTVWYRFTGTGGPVLLDTFGSDFDTMIVVYPAAAPVASAALDCDDDASGSDATSSLYLGTVAGAEYLVQVGGCGGSGCGAPAGSLWFSVLGADDRAFAAPVEPDGSAAVTNVGATLEGGEVSSCGPTAFRSTVWYRVPIGEPGRLAFSATSQSFSPTVSAYRAEGGGPIACAAAAADSLSTRVAFDVQPGTYLFQVGSIGGALGSWSYQVEFAPNLDVDGDGSQRPADCNDGAPTIRPGVRDVVNGVDDDCDGIVDPDRDGDGYLRAPAQPSDCNDADPAIRPGAREILGNRVDENCDGRRGFREIRSSVQINVAPVGAGYPVRRFVIRPVPSRSRLQISCRGRGCPKGRPFVKRFSRGRSVYDVQSYARRIRMYRGTQVEVRITARLRVGKAVIFRRRGREVRRIERCLPPGTTRPRRC